MLGLGFRLYPLFPFHRRLSHLYRTFPILCFRTGVSDAGVKALLTFYAYGSSSLGICITIMSHFRDRQTIIEDVCCRSTSVHPSIIISPGVFSPQRPCTGHCLLFPMPNQSTNQTARSAGIASKGDKGAKGGWHYKLTGRPYAPLYLTRDRETTAR